MPPARADKRPLAKLHINSHVWIGIEWR